MPAPPYTPLPPAPLRSDNEDDFVDKAEGHVAAQSQFGSEMHAIALYAQEQAETAVATAAIIVPIAAAAAASANFLGPWSSLAGAVSVPASVHHAGEYWMLLSDLADVSAKEPGVDSEWQILPLGGNTAATVSGSDNITLAATSACYQTIAMTAMGKSVTLPSAFGLVVGGPRYIITNSGGYPFGVRDGAGTLLTAVAPGGTALLALADKSTAAGVWGVTGDRLAPGLITSDQVFGATYTATVFRQFVSLDDNKSVHFCGLAANGFAAFCIDNATGAIGTPVVIASASSEIPKACFKISATTAVVFYGPTTATLRAVVVSLSEDTTLSVGAAVTISASGVAVEDWSGAPKIVALDTSHYLVSYSNSPTTSVVALEITGGTICTWGTPVDIITVDGLDNSTATYALTSTTALVLYHFDGATPYSLGAVVVSVSDTVCTVGTPDTVANVHGINTPASSCLLSDTAALVVSDSNGSNVSVWAVTVSGTTATFGSPLVVESTGSLQNYLYYTASYGTRYTPHLRPLSATQALLWYVDSTGYSRSVVLTESSGVVTKGEILYRAISNSTNTNANYGVVAAFSDTDFLIGYQSLSQAEGYGNYLQPCKIAGSSLSKGASLALPELPGSPESSIWTRLASGKYVLTASRHGYAGVPIIVVDSNGDHIARCGSIPSQGLYGPLAPRNVAPYRVVIETTSLTNSLGLNTYQLRVLNVEVAK